MIAWHFTSAGPDFVVIAETVAEAFEEVSRAMRKREQISFSEMTVKRLQGDVLICPTVLAHLEVEQLTRE